jgi:hypothetical protein
LAVCRINDVVSRGFTPRLAVAPTELIIFRHFPAIFPGLRCASPRAGGGAVLRTSKDKIRRSALTDLTLSGEEVNNYANAELKRFCPVYYFRFTERPNVSPNPTITANSSALTGCTDKRALCSKTMFCNSGMVRK